MIFGGTDAPSSTIEFAMAEIMKNPQVLKKAQQELSAVVGEENVVEESHIQNLPYLQAIMKETLRIHPALPLLAPHSPSKSTVVSGYTIPKGSQVLINAWAIHRDPYSWEKPLEFKPERFLNNNWDYNGSDLSYIPFGCGRRMCAGTAMAERMVLYLVATMLHSFDWKLERGENMDVFENFGTVLKKKTPLVAIPTPRLADLSLYQ